MQTSSVNEVLRRCVEYLGHSCIGQALGVRSALQGASCEGEGCKP